MKLGLGRIVAFGLALSCAFASVTVQAQNKDAPKAPAAGTPEAQVAARFAERAGMKPDQVFKGPAGLYEVLVRGDCGNIGANRRANRRNHLAIQIIQHRHRPEQCHYGPRVAGDFLRATVHFNALVWLFGSFQSIFFVGSSP